MGEDRLRRASPWSPDDEVGALAAGRSARAPRCDVGGADPGKLSCVESVARLLTHESRTPLNAITGFAELLLAGDSGSLSAEARSAVAEIARAARDLEAAMAAAGVLIELGLLPPRAVAGPLPLAPLLRNAGFEQLPGEPLVIVGTADRWAGILSAVRGFLVRRADRRCDCLALPVRGTAAVGVRLWAEPGPSRVSDLGKIELGLAARLAAIEGAWLALGAHGEIRLAWPVERVAELPTCDVVMAPDAISDVI
jgi:hypothetical protein